MISDKTKKALRIIREEGRIYPKRFAMLMWPNSESWEKVYNIGRNGATRGKGMWLCAGSYLSKLHKMGLVKMWLDDYSSRYYYLSKKGSKALRGESDD